MTGIPADAPTSALTFTATRGGFFRLLLVNTLLTVATIGIYRFWARTKVRRYVWRHIRFLDDPLEYTGTGGELFLGFLIVVAVLFPLGLVYGAIGKLVPPGQIALRVALEVAYFTVFFLLLQIGFYRMWRYRMSRTVWRGVRFGLDGSSWTYLKLTIGWTLLTLVTLGVAYPWMKIDLWRYQIAHTRIGAEAMSFSGDARSLLMPWLAVDVPLIIYIAVIGFVALTGGPENLERLRGFMNSQQTLLIVVGTLFVLGVLALPFTYLWYRVRQTRMQISGLSVGDATFRSRLPYGRLLGAGAISIFLSLCAISPVFVLIDRNGAGFGFFADLILVFVLAVTLVPLIWTVIFGFEVMKQTVSTATVTNASAIEDAAQAAPSSIKTGEGLADALDIGGF